MRPVGHQFEISDLFIRYSAVRCWEYKDLKNRKAKNSALMELIDKYIIHEFTHTHAHTHVCISLYPGEITKCFGNPGEIRSEEGEWVGKRAREEFQVGRSR